MVIIMKEKINSDETVPMRNVKTPSAINDSIDFASVPDEIFAQMFTTAFSGTRKLICFFE